MRKNLLATIVCFTLFMTSCGNSDQLTSDALKNSATPETATQTTLDLINAPDAKWRNSEYATYVLTERDLSSSVRYEEVQLFTEAPATDENPAELKQCGIEKSLGSFAGISVLIQLSDGTQIQQEIREATPEKIDEFLDITEKVLTCTNGEEVLEEEPLKTITEPLGSADRSIQYATTEETASGDIEKKQFVFSRYDNKLIIIVQASIEEAPKVQNLVTLAEKISKKSK